VLSFGSTFLTVIGNWLAYDLLVGTLRSKTLHFWKFMVVGFFMHISFIVDAFIALRALTCPLTCLFKIQNA
jgi:hypothetical protein